MPVPRRSRDEIVADMLAARKPLARDRAAVRAKMLADVDWMREFKLPPAPGKIKERLDDYLKALRMAKRKHFSVSNQALSPEQLDAEIACVRDDLKYVRKRVRQGSPQRDKKALAAINLAAGYFSDEERRRRGAKQQIHRCAQLLYEAATGKRNADLLHYMRNPRALTYLKRRLTKAPWWKLPYGL
jgi:hypothetical protein